MDDAPIEITVSLLTPFLAYLPAEWLHVSGVLAAVTSGIYVSRRIGHTTSARVRLRATRERGTLPGGRQGSCENQSGLHRTIPP